MVMRISTSDEYIPPTNEYLLRSFTSPNAGQMLLGETRVDRKLFFGEKRIGTRDIEIRNKIRFFSLEPT